MKTTKRTLIMSVLSMVICAAMLAGTTFAWFTDTASTGVNKIQAGNLDVELYYMTSAAGATYEKVTGTTEVFNKNALWEPGYTEVVYFKVANEGSLALKYALGIEIVKQIIGVNANDEEIALCDHILYGVFPADEVTDRATAIAKVTEEPTTVAEAMLTESDLLAGKSAEYAMVLYLPQNTGNAVNYKTGTTPPSVEFAVSLVATQLAHEEDSFDSKYDEAASYAMTSGRTFSSGTHVLSTGITVTKANEVAVTATGAETNVNIEGGVYNGGEYGNNVCVWAKDGAKVTIKDGTFTVGKDASGEGNSVVYATGGATVTIEGGFFYTDYSWNSFYYVLNQNNRDPGNFVVKGGTFVNYNPAKGDDNLGGNFVAAGYKSVAVPQENGDVWYVVVPATATGKTVDSGATTLSEGVAVTGAGEKAVTAAGTGTSVTIEGGIYDGGENGDNVCVWAKDGAKVTIKDGTFTVGKDANGEGNAVVYTTGGATVTIEGGFFYTDYSWNSFYYVLNQNNSDPGTIVVKGGTFVNYDPSKGDDNRGGNFVADGYTVVTETHGSDTWYIVVPA